MVGTAKTVDVERLRNSQNVPLSFNKTTANSQTFLLQKGQLNKLQLRQQIINEQAESSRNIIGAVTASNIVGQIFKASHDNINAINMTFESAAGIDFDDFEEYVDSAALQVEWIATNATYKAELETTVVHSGDNSMEMKMDALVGDEVGRDFDTTDFTGFTGQFWMYSTHTVNLMAAKVFIRDSSGYSSSADIITVGANQWDKYIFEVASLELDNIAEVTDITDIVEIGFRVSNSQPNSLMYIDDMVSVPGPGSIELKLWDMGTTLPESTVDALDTGTQYEKLGDAGISGIQTSSVILQLLGGKRMYHIDGFVAGPAIEIPDNEVLIGDHYYAITVHYIDTETSIYGPDPTIENYYENGYSFTAPDEATPISATGEDENLMFAIFSTQDAYIYKFVQKADEAPNGNSTMSIFIEDEEMTVTDIINSGVKGMESINEDFPIPFFMGKGYKFEQYYNDDFTDLVSSIVVVIHYYFEPQEVNG